MAILKLQPSFKDYLWGGKRLVTDFHKAYDGDILAESWELSCHKDGPCYIANGSHAGKTLAEYVQGEGKAALGTNFAKFDQFPILIKFIDAAQDLSVQVHPDDAFARQLEKEPYGKTEVWYVVDCAPGAYLYYGFSKEISRDEFARRIKENTLLEVLNKVEVKKGDVFFIEAGTIHAIGAGCLIAEIQQNSNLTYRVYDYGRKDKNGNTRELHVSKALQVTAREPLPLKNFAPHIAACKYFTVDRVAVDGSYAGKVEQTSFVSILVVDGAGKLTAGEETVSFCKGDSLLLTADTGAYTLEGNCDVLLTTL